MTTQQLVGAALDYALRAVGAAAAAYFAARILPWIRQHVKNRAVSTAIDAMTRIVAAGVVEAEKTVVADLKASGKWNAATQKKVKDDVAAAAARTGANVLDSLKAEANTIDVQAMIAGMIEANVSALPASKAAPAAPAEPAAAPTAPTAPTVPAPIEPEPVPATEPAADKPA